jgi:hypothetical protein
MDTTSQSVDSQAPIASQPGKETRELTDLMDAIEKESGPESETSPPSPSFIDLKSPISPKLINALGGRKMAAYLVSVIVTALLAVLDKASSEVLLALQTALGAFVGGNAAEHKFKGK